MADEHETNHAVDIRTTRPRLRIGLRLIPRTDRNKTPWFRIEDDRFNRFHRIGLAEYEFLLALDGLRTIEQAREQAALSTNQRHILSPDQAESLVLWAVGESLIDGHASARHSTSANSRSSLAWIKLPLVSGDANWQPLERIAGWLFHPRSIVAAILLYLLAGCLVLLDCERFVSDLSTILAPAGWLTLTTVWLGLKVVHEMGHLVCCRRSGGKIGEVGVAWMLLAPVAYVDLTDLYRMHSRWDRVLTCLAGIYIELIIAAIAVLGWTCSTSPTLCHLLATIAVTASVGSLLFNLNPLMRLDGYHAVCDLLDRPNLASEGTTAMQSVTARLFFGRKSKPQAMQARLAIYGLAAFAYRIVVSIGLVSAAHAMHGRVGLLVMATLLSIVSIPSLVRAVINILREFRARPAVLVRFSVTSFLFVATLGAGWQCVGSWQSAWHGIVEYADDSPIRCSSAGKIIRVFVESGQTVKAGDVLVELENLSIVADRAKAESELAAGRARWQRLRESHIPAEAASEQNTNEAIETRLTYLRRQEQNLILRAPRSGTVIAREPLDWLGQWFDEGDALLFVVDITIKKAIVAIPQSDMEQLNDINKKQVCFQRSDGQQIKGRVTSITHQAELTPPHPALAVSAGGPLAVRADDDNKSVSLLSPHFRLEAYIHDPNDRLYPGQKLTLTR